MLPILGRLGPFTLHTYTVLINIGIAVGLAALYLRAPAGKGARWLDAGLAAAIGALVGARLLFAFANDDFYFRRIEEIPAIWRGGLAWPGAVAGGLLAAWAFTRRVREPLGPLLDALAVPIVLLSLLGWSGCQAAGCVYGFEVAPDQLPAAFTSHAPDLYGLSLPRFPTQAAGMAWSAVALLAVWAVGRGPGQRWPAGALGLFALSLAALGMLALSLTRGDPVPLLQGVRVDLIGSAVVLAAAGLAWAGRAFAGARPDLAGMSADAAPADSVSQP